MNVSSFSRNKPIIWETFDVLFDKVIDMKKIIHFNNFWYKKDSQIYLKFLCTFQKKGIKPIIYVVVRKKYVIHPKNFWTSQIFSESNASTPARYFSLCRGYPLPFFFNVFGKKGLYIFSVSVLLFALVERLCFSRVWDFFIPYLRWKLAISYS